MIDAFEATYFGSVPGWAIIVFIWGAAGILFTAQVVQAARLIRLGGPDDRFQDIGGRMREWLSGWLGQKRVLEDRVIGTLHAMIFWGFLALATDMFDLASGGRFEPLLAGIHPMLANSWNLLVDMGYLLAAIGTFGALYRRVIVKPPKMEHESMVEGISILLTILGICGTAFIIEAHAGAGRWEPVGAWVAANLMTNFSASTQAGLAASSYWLHMMLIAGFLVAIPASKHMHLVRERTARRFRWMNWTSIRSGSVPTTSSAGARCSTAGCAPLASAVRTSARPTHPASRSTRCR